jgi:serine/threonine protein kinase
MTPPPSPDQSLEARLGAVADDFLDRLHRGERPEVAAYVRAHPDLAELLDQVLPVLQATHGSETGPMPARPLDPGPRLPARLRDYHIVRQIGRGGMGVVYEAVHQALGRRVALKLLAGGDRQSRRQRFRLEGQAASRLSHPNIVATYDAGEEDGVLFLVMEYVEGIDLAQHVKENGPFPLADALQFITQAAHGLAHAHRNGIVHRDIKPANLMLSARGGGQTAEHSTPPLPLTTVKILDMGLARLQSDEGDRPPSLTTTGDLLGTAAYMAPEQGLNPRRADHRVDVYSLGCTFYYLLTGRHMYPGDSPLAVVMAHREQPIPSLPAVPAAVQAVFRRMVGKQPHERYATMDALAADLEGVSAGRRPQPRRRSRSRPALLGMVGVLVLMALLVGGLIGSRRDIGESRTTAAAQGPFFLG